MRRPLSVVLEQFLKLLSASLGHCARVPPSAWGVGGGLDEGDGIRVLGEGRGARTDLFAAVTDWFLALHVLALPYIRDLVTSWSMRIAEKHAGARRGSVAKLAFGGKIRKSALGKSIARESQLSCFR